MNLRRLAAAPLRLLPVVVGVLAACAAPPASAVQCAVSVTPVSFGPYDIFANVDATSSGSVTITCTRETSDPSSIRVAYAAAASAGASNSYASRTLLGPLDALRYNLYTNANYTTVWGNGASATLVFSGRLTLSQGNPTRSAMHTVYGRIPRLQDIGAGAYVDNINVTVTF